MAYPIIFIVSLLIPYPSVQHFIWPLHWCLLADICNHTYIPECGSEHPEDVYDRRLFTDECDLYEYNCDYVTDYYPVNYSSCFNLPPTPCPPVIPCPSIPTCPDHRFHTTVRKLAVTQPIIITTETTTETTPETTTETTTVTTTVTTTETTPETTTETTTEIRKKTTFDDEYTRPGFSLPADMSMDWRRYSPTFKKKKRRTTWPMGITKTAPTTTRTKILKRITVKKNGRVFVKIIKAIIKKSPYQRRKFVNLKKKN